MSVVGWYGKSCILSVGAWRGVVLGLLENGDGFVEVTCKGCGCIKS
jgi:hypothetical protein